MAIPLNSLVLINFMLTVAFLHFYLQNLLLHFNLFNLKLDKITAMGAIKHSEVK